MDDNYTTRNNKIISDYQNNVKLSDMSIKFGLSIGRIKHILIANNIGQRRKIRKNINLINQKFGKVIVIKMIESNNSREQGKWLCRCECGNEKIFNGRWLKESKNGINCGCSHRNNKHEAYFRGCGEISKTFFNNIKKTALRRKIDFQVSIEYVWDLFLKQNKKCALSGLDIYFGKFTYDVNTASLDRIDSKLGYIEGNVQWVHKDINIMKGSFKEKSFLELCHIISDYNKVKNLIPDKSNNA